MNPKPIKTYDEEYHIQQAIIRELTLKGWLVKSTHGNAYQSGFPDLFCTHARYGMRWLEVKKPKGYQFTAAQLEWFPKFCAFGAKVWIATTHIGVEELLMRPSNWHMFLLNVRSANV